MASEKVTFADGRRLQPRSAVITNYTYPDPTPARVASADIDHDVIILPGKLAHLCPDSGAAQGDGGISACPSSKTCDPLAYSYIRRPGAYGCFVVALRGNQFGLDLSAERPYRMPLAARSGTDIEMLIRQSLNAVGRTEASVSTAFTDGCLGLRRILADAGVSELPILDWFHIGMRL
jgi:hypothetical protein